MDWIDHKVKIMANACVELKKRPKQNCFAFIAYYHTESFRTNKTRLMVNPLLSWATIQQRATPTKTF